MRIENLLTGSIKAEETEQVKETKNVSKDKEERKMKYNELSKLMSKVYEEMPWLFDPQYEITNWCETAEIIANAGCDEYGLDYLCTFQEASDKYYTYLADMTEESLEDIIVDCEGDLSAIGEEFKRIFWDGLEEFPEEGLRGYIAEFCLEDYLAESECIEYERATKTLEDAFVEFCAYHHCLLKDQSKKTIQEYLRLFNYFPEEMREKCVSEVIEDDPQEFFEKCVNDTEMRFPFESFISFCNELFDYAVETKICDFNPVIEINCEGKELYVIA